MKVKWSESESESEVITFLVSDFDETSFIISSEIKKNINLAVLRKKKYAENIPTSTFKIWGILAKKNIPLISWNFGHN